MDILTGRDKEQASLNRYINSKQSEFIVIYGRKRVGKTFLVTETLEERIDFEMTGVLNGSKDDQLTSFGESLKASGFLGKPP